VYWQNGYVDIVRPRTILELDSMVGQTVLPFVVEGKIHELDYRSRSPRSLRRSSAGNAASRSREERHRHRHEHFYSPARQKLLAFDLSRRVMVITGGSGLLGVEHAKGHR